ARSRIWNSENRVADLYNNYAHVSFNFCPTLLSWLEDNQPRLIQDLKDAVAFERSCAMAQAYAHPILPLADARDRHTQILWGIREFQHRFGFHPEGIWLPECGICPETVRVLVDHRIKFVILSPHQASRVRPFGEREWRDASMGSVDTRRAYRLFETDGGGRTHFDRHLDVIFYTPGLNLKVSFEHLLLRPDDLAREIERCYNPDSGEAQLVSIVTDGEIYGHHEKGGEEALARLFHDLAPKIGVRTLSAGEFIRDHPPAWEVKLWNGEDNLGSSWSCEHGIGRWFRDCGCRPPTRPDWNQAWRDPLRSALNRLRDRVRRTAGRELAGLLRDVDDAGNDYISVVLEPGPESRLAFIRRHAIRDLDTADLKKLWCLLEALRSSILMYASCGWFFDELSGLEPVQNLRYALRAAELIQPWQEVDSVQLLEQELARAKSNLPEFGDGGGVFRRLVLPSRFSGREIAAGMAICLAAGFPMDCLSWRLVDYVEAISDPKKTPPGISWGSFVCHDARLDRFIRTAWVAKLAYFDNSGVVLHGYEEIQGDPARTERELPIAADTDFSWIDRMGTQPRPLRRKDYLDRFGEEMVPIHRLPEAIQGMLYRRFAGAQETELLREAAKLGARAIPFLDRARINGVSVPGRIAGIAANTFELEMHQALCQAIGAMSFADDGIAAFRQPLDAARELGLQPDRDLLNQHLHLTGLELLEWLIRLSDPGWFASLTPVVLPDGREWLAPQSRRNHRCAFPEAGDFSLALGTGLAKLRVLLAAEPYPGSAALRKLPLLELADFANRTGFDLRRAIPLSIEFWNFLDRHLFLLIAGDPEGMMASEAGDRLRKLGAVCGFAAEAVERHIQAAVRAAAH
ncbi:MAG: DUF3536 domain-containing protein, partial [Planctomycetes bacterium]|nr:DUF3536 domain-containing protein [Planctomycetota bacterium]